MSIEKKLDSLYPQLRTGKKCSNPNCHNMASEVHHICRRNIDFLRYDINNLLPLCHSCHAEIHDKGLHNRGMDFVNEETKAYLLQRKNKDFKQYLIENNLTKDEFFSECEKDLLIAIENGRIKQNTPEWLEEKNYGIGASEIAAVIKVSLSKERLIELMGEKQALSFLNEKLYITGYQVYHKIKKGYRREPIPDEFSDYGHKMEKYATYKLRDDSDFIFRNTDDFIKRPDINKYLVCSPDGYAKSLNESYVDVNGVECFEKEPVVEIKTVNAYKAIRENVFYNGLPWQYLFQNQQQMMCCNKEAGVFVSIVLSPEIDTPYNRGKISALIEQELFEEIDRIFGDKIEIEKIIYSKIPEMQETIREALKSFEYMLDNDIIPEMNTTEPSLKLQDFKVYQAVYKNNPDGEKLITNQDFMNINDEKVNFYEFFNDFIGLSQVIKDNKKTDDLNKLIVKKFMYDNKLCAIQTLDGGVCKLTKDGKLLIKGVN